MIRRSVYSVGTTAKQSEELGGDPYFTDFIPKDLVFFVYIFELRHKIYAGLDDWSSSPAGTGDFALLHNVQTGSGARPASYTVGTGGSFPGAESDQSPPSNAEVKNSLEGMITN
jgi:hypothetical protein